MRGATRTLELIWYLRLIFVFAFSFFAHNHNFSPFGVFFLRFVSFSLCQCSRLSPPQLKEKSHGWVCLAFLVCSSPFLFLHDALQVDRNNFPHPSFFQIPPFLLSISHFIPFHHLLLLFLSVFHSFSHLSRSPLRSPHRSPSAHPSTTINNCLCHRSTQPKPMRSGQTSFTCFTQTHTQYFDIVTAVCVCRWTLLAFHWWGRERPDWWWLWQFIHDAVLFLAMLPLPLSVCVKVI